MLRGKPSPILSPGLIQETQLAKVALQVLAATENDAVPATCPGAGDVGRQVINEQTPFRRRRDVSLTMRKETAVGLAHADLVRQEQTIKVGERLGELAAKLTRVQLVGVAAEE